MPSYRVSGPRPVLGNEPGAEFEHEFTPEEEADHLRLGRLEIVPRTYRVVGGQQVYGAELGETFVAALPAGQETALIESGAVEIAEVDPDELKRMTREELNDEAREAGIQEPEKLPNKGAVIEAIRAANSAESEE